MALDSDPENDDVSESLPTTILNERLSSDIPDEFQAKNKAAKFLASQLLSFQGCTRATHDNIQITREVEDAENGIAVLGLESIAAHLRQINLPSLLGRSEFLKKDEVKLSSVQFENLYTGNNIIDSTRPARIDFGKEKEKTRSDINPGVTFDIDSVLAIPRSLGVAKMGMKISFYPPRVNNIHNDLHVALPVPTSSGSRTRNTSLHLIPHIHFGTMFGFSDLSLYLFFPRLCNDTRANSYLTDIELERFYDKIVLPAIYKTCPSHVLQHLPASFEKAKRDCYAAGTETLSRRTRTTGRTQNLTYMISAQYLDTIWKNMITEADKPGQHDFKDFVLFLNGKNLKTITKQTTAGFCFTSFLNLWDMTCDRSHLDSNYTWLDYGKEVVDAVCYLIPENDVDQNSEVAYTYLWRRCCLDSYAKHAKMGQSKGGTRSTMYCWGLTQDVANLTVTPTGLNPLRLAGLAYSQFYSSTKEIFDSAKVYPFDNNALEGLCVDPKLSATWFNVGGGSKWEINNVRQAYIASKRRCFEGLVSSGAKSFGTREEHRVTLTLLTKIGQILEQKNRQAANVMININHRPFWAHRTTDIIDFLHANINKFVFGFEYVMSLTSHDSVQWEHTRMMVMFLRILRRSFGGHVLSREAGLWWDTRFGGIWGENGMEGMGFQKSLKKYGYTYFVSDKIDWETWTFAQPFAGKMLFNNNNLLRSYRKRWQDVQEVTSISQEFDFIFDTLKMHPENKEYWHFTLRYLSTRCITSFRAEVWKTIQSELCCNDIEACLLGEIGFSVDAVCSRLQQNIRLKYVQSYNRRQFNPLERAQYIWGFDDDRKRDSWDTKQFRYLCQRVVNFVCQMKNEKASKRWFATHCLRFLSHNWIFPQPVNGKFYQKSTGKDGTIQRSWFSAFHANPVKWWEPNDWKTGSDEDGCYIEGEPDRMKFQRLTVVDFRDSVTGNNVDLKRLEDIYQHRFV